MAILVKQDGRWNEGRYKKFWNLNANKRKAKHIMEFVLETGNFGRNRNIERSKYFFIGKIQAACFKLGDFAHHARLFPLDSVRFFIHYALNGISVSKDRLNDKKV